MANRNQKLFSPKYQAATVGGDGSTRGAGAHLGSDGRVGAIQDSAVIPYGVFLTRETTAGSQVELFKEGGSREAVVLAARGSYRTGQRLALDSSGVYKDGGSGEYSHYFAIASETKTISDTNGLIKAILVVGDNRKIERLTIESGVDFRIGQAARLDGDGAALHPSGPAAFFSHVAVTNATRGSEGLFHTRVSSLEVPVRTSAADYVAGDLLEVHGSSGEFRKTTTTNARYWAVSMEAKTTTEDDPLLRAEIIGGKV